MQGTTALLCFRNSQLKSFGKSTGESLKMHMAWFLWKIIWTPCASLCSPVLLTEQISSMSCWQWIELWIKKQTRTVPVAALILSLQNHARNVAHRRAQSRAGGTESTESTGLGKEHRQSWAGSSAPPGSLQGLHRQTGLWPGHSLG